MRYFVRMGLIFGAVCLLGTAVAQNASFDAQVVSVMGGPVQPSSSSSDFASKVKASEAGAFLHDDLPLKHGNDVLMRMSPESSRVLRGAASIKIYRQASPAVVLVVTDDGIGSGSLLNTRGDIVTNWHVVAGYRHVGVVFKPVQEGIRITSKDLRRAKVVRIDEVSDLALLRVDSVPQGVVPIELGDMSEAVVGADVHAIGHPTGEAWTYTMGVISQMRRDYQWTTESEKAHRANVIQTQTPINPGNSGGPLLGGDGRMVGVNSFKSQGEALNFAVSVDEVRRFLSSKSDRVAAAAPSKQTRAASEECEAKQLYSGLDEAKKYHRVGIDANCDGKVDVELQYPVDTSKPLVAVVDKNGDGNVDVMYVSDDREMNWILSFHDVDFDGKWDLVGHHKRGVLEASRFERYDQYAAR